MYAKIFTSMYQGTLRGNAHGLLVFTNLLAHCDPHGVADIHPRAIAEETGLTIDQVKAALVMLAEPDPESRSPEENGRRITLLDEHRDWGWLIVNYAKYRAIRNAEDRRTQSREAMRKLRASKSREPMLATVSHGEPPFAQAEGEAEAEAVNQHRADSTSREPPTLETLKLPSNPVAAELSACLTANGIKGQPFNPRVREWADAGFTVPQLQAAIAKARENKPAPENIPLAYLDPILRSPPKAGSEFGTAWRSDDKACDEVGRKLGISAKRGEGYSEFRQRIAEKIREVRA